MKKEDINNLFQKMTKISSLILMNITEPKEFTDLKNKIDDFSRTYDDFYKENKIKIEEAALNGQEFANKFIIELETFVNDLEKQFGEKNTQANPMSSILNMVDSVLNDKNVKTKIDNSINNIFNAVNDIFNPQVKNQDSNQNLYPKKTKEYAIFLYDDSYTKQSDVQFILKNIIGFDEKNITEILKEIQKNGFAWILQSDEDDYNSLKFEFDMIDAVKERNKDLQNLRLSIGKEPELNKSSKPKF